MTLIVCLKARDSIVVAADSLTTNSSGHVFSKQTNKIHKFGQKAATAGCGLARVSGKCWDVIFHSNHTQVSRTKFSKTVTNLRNFLDSEIQKVPRNHYNACNGGNTFLLAEYNPYVNGFVVSELKRIGDRRAFETPTSILSYSTEPNFITWRGDIKNITTFIKLRSKLYSSKMSTPQAIDFAYKSILGGLKAKPSSKKTIGGDFITICVVSNKRVETLKKPI